MPSSQAPTSTKEAAGFTLHTERLGPLPRINHFIERIGLHDALSRHIPPDARCSITHASALGVLLRSIIVEREPIYRQHETVHGFADGMFGISAQEMEHLSDDRLGRALDRLFDADRTALLTELVLAVGQRFGVRSRSSTTTPHRSASAAVTAAPEAARFALAPRPRSPSGIRRRTGRTSSNCCSF